MGLTASSTGISASDNGLVVKKRSPNDKIIAVAGNPNVGKSTLFNALTGLHQHTGNWPGKTVASAQGYCKTEDFDYVLVDIPGTYSLLAHSAEEEVARNFICFGGADAAVVVCDATCLERSLNLALQVMEVFPNTIVCVNLLDEAKRAGIKIDLALLEKRLGVPVAGTSAHKKKTLRSLTEKLDKVCSGEITTNPRKLRYSEPIENAISIVEKVVVKRNSGQIPARRLALMIIDNDASLKEELRNQLGGDFFDEELDAAVSEAHRTLAEAGITTEMLSDKIVSCILQNAEEIAHGAVSQPAKKLPKIDKILTSRALGFPIMILALMVIFWITIVGANYPSEWLGSALFWLGDRLSDFFVYINAPEWLRGVVVDGAYRVLAWVASVMLPPMAIFFPLFTLLEDLGYLPRVAYNLDKPFCKCKACGKQALCMTMGFGCNAAGVVGARIIDSRRERLIAILTNNFVPCNGRFPIILKIISLFFIGGAIGLLGSFLSAAALTAVIILGILMTFVVSRILSATILKGEPSSFTLELPPFRKPQIGKILVRSLLDRTIFVLGRAAAVAAPAGAIIWVLANVSIDGASVLSYITGFFEPFGQFIGMDGVIVTAFLLGLPANEIVLPLAVMMYMQQGVLAEIAPSQMFELFTANGWTPVTAVCVIVFTLMHFPCSTTLLTIKKEAGGIKWAALAFAIPTLCGIILCAIISGISRIIA
ncbi:MAG: ferrous iron transport protein B [Oscillospiraceae bacterium]|nr:ferrous iron transport protein B [Oscillospiraceae bacterium]